MADLNEILGTDEVANMTKSWLAWSATNIIFGYVDDEWKLLLGVRSNAEPRAIPEPGDLALIGGFNTGVPGPAMYREVADFHAKAQLGISLTPELCGDFLPCEYEMADITEPLNTPQGALHLKRVANDRVVMLTPEQVADIRPQGKIRDVVWMSHKEFLAAVTTDTLSFPHQVPHVVMAFNTFDRFISARDQALQRDWIEPKPIDYFGVRWG